MCVHVCKNISGKVDKIRTQKTDSIDISSLFTHRLHQNVGDYITIDKEEIDKKREGQKGETEKKKKNERNRNLIVKRIYTPELSEGRKYWLYIDTS